MTYGELEHCGIFVMRPWLWFGSGKNGDLNALHWADQRLQIHKKWFKNEGPTETTMKYSYCPKELL